MAVPAEYYVYELIDPRNQKPFYVGKGKKNRIHYHERESLKGVCSEKCNKIRDIHNSGLNIVKNFIAYFWDEGEAYQFEKLKIDEIGIFNLTNISLGGGAVRIVKGKRRNKKPIVYSPKPFSPSDAMQIIRNFKGHFAFWVKATKAGEDKVEIEYKNVSTPKFHKAVFEIFSNKLMPRVFEEAINDNKNHKEISNICSQYGISLRFNYGS